MAQSCAYDGKAGFYRPASTASVTELFTVVRGIRDIISLFRDHITNGPLGLLLKGFTLEEHDQATLPLELDTRLAELRGWITSFPSDTMDATSHCVSAVDCKGASLLKSHPRPLTSSQRSRLCCSTWLERLDFMHWRREMSRVGKPT
jgi:hypothetical protein